jgi:hypothetical protein
MNLLDTLNTAASFFVITLLVHIAICKLGSPRNFMLKGLVLGCFSATGCAVYFYYARSSSLLGPYIVFSAWLFYLMVLINLLNSVTLKMLANLYSAPAGTLSAQDFGLAFNTEDGFETRLTMLHSSQLIHIQGTTVTLKPKARYLMAIVHQVKAVLSIE